MRAKLIEAALLFLTFNCRSFVASQFCVMMAFMSSPLQSHSSSQLHHAFRAFIKSQLTATVSHHHSCTDGSSLSLNDSLLQSIHISKVFIRNDASRIKAALFHSIPATSLFQIFHFMMASRFHFHHCFDLNRSFMVSQLSLICTVPFDSVSLVTKGHFFQHVSGI